MNFCENLEFFSGLLLFLLRNSVWVDFECLLVVCLLNCDKRTREYRTIVKLEAV
jgi:hypothetical protein